MKLAIDMARFTALASLTFLFCALSWVAMGMRAVPAHVDGVLLRAEGVESKINASAVNLDHATAAWAAAAQQQAASVNGLVLDARTTLRQTSAAVGDLRGAVSDVRGSVAVANAQMAQVGPVLDAARGSVTELSAQAAGVLAEARPVLAEAAQTERDVDAFVTAPELKATLGSVRETSANVAAGSAEATVILRDARKEADALVAPRPWYRRAWSDGLKVGELVWDFTR